MKQYDLLQIMIEATSGYVKNELTSTECSNMMTRALNEYTEQLNILHVSQRSELLKALNGIMQCCDGNEPAHEQIYHIANDAVKAFNCG